MTLKEKFKEVLINPIWQMTMIDKQIEVADEYAIDFAKWCDNNRDEELIDKTHKELLEIYKKEKGL